MTMKIIRARVLGYCMGVRRAVEKALSALCEHKQNIYTLGPLIHNPSVLKSLEQKGVRILTEDGISLIKQKSTVIIRAHGTGPEVLDSLKKDGHEVLDATCPRVQLSQKRAFEYHEKGYTVIIAGDKNHGEVTGIASHAKGDALVIENESDAQSLCVPQKAVLIAQTTFSPQLFEKITGILQKKAPNLVVFNSICTATRERQKAVLDIAGSADGILVIGGKNSANTRRLYETALSCFKRAALIEDEGEIPSDFYSLKTVAITAGASTPDEIIERVEEALKTRL